MYSLICLLSVLAGCLLSNSQAQAQIQSVNLTPYIVQRISEANPSQSYPNTAGTSNSLYVAAQGGPRPANDPFGLISLTNRVHTIVAFQGIPPFAKTCELRVVIPSKALLSQAATSSAGTVLGGFNPSMFLYPLELPLSQSGSWTWDRWAQRQPTQANNFGLYTAVFLSKGVTRVIYPMPRCPGPSGPSGGVVGFTFGMSNVIPFVAANVFLSQDYSDPGDLAGVYLRYTY